MKVTRFLSGFYRMTADRAFANIKKLRDGEFKGMWAVDIRNNAGDLIQYAGVWKTKRDGIEEAEAVLQRYN